MEPKKLKMNELKKMEAGEIPMTEEGERRLAEMKQMNDGLKSTLSAARVAIATIPKLPQGLLNSIKDNITGPVQSAQATVTQFQAGQSAAVLAGSALTSNIKAFQESMRPFIEQMAEVLNRVRIVKGNVQEVYENEKRWYETNYQLRFRDYDIFWRWMCEEIDRCMFDDGKQIKLDYESIVNYYGRFCDEQSKMRHSFIKKEIQYSSANESNIFITGGNLKKESCEIEDMYNGRLKPSENEKLDKQQSFLDEIATVERKIESNGNIGVQKVFAPILYTPIATLWESIGDKESVKARELFRQEVEDQVGFSTQVLNKLVLEYEVAVKKQPDKRTQLLIEYRDWYVNRLAERYVPIEKWYYSFWNGEKKVVEKIGDLESEIFIFCYNINKSFTVGLKLMQSLYGYCRAIDQFNEMLQLAIPEQKSAIGSVESGNQMRDNSTNRWQSQIFISSQMQTRLFKTLIDYTPEEQREELEKLLTHGLIEGRVWIKLRADSLAYVFKQARESGNSPILADMRETARWLATYMRFGKTTPKDVSEATTYKVLRRNLVVDKSNQIRLKV